MSAALLSVENLTVRFPVHRGFLHRNAWLHAVTDVSFQVNPGEILGLVGESGSGKTTIGQCVLRLQEPSGGRILFQSRDIAGFSGSDLQSFRRAAQPVFQDPFGSPRSAYTPGRDPRRTAGDPSARRARSRRRVSGCPH